MGDAEGLGMARLQKTVCFRGAEMGDAEGLGMARLHFTRCEAMLMSAINARAQPAPSPYMFV
jgi:hypothetical protein